MGIDLTAPRSRRALLAGVLGSAAAAVTASLAGAQRVLAAGDDGTPMVVGGHYTDAQTDTLIWNRTNDRPALDARNLAEGIGVFGQSQSQYGVYGYSPDHVGVRGLTGSRAGYGLEGEGSFVAVKGKSTATGPTNGSGVGVFGTSVSPDGAGVDGRSPNVGVHGESDGTGVLGEGANGGIGVRGEATHGGIGILGNSDTYRAVVGVAGASSGATIGVMGETFSDAGTGVRGWAAGEGTGIYGFSGASFPPGAVPARVGVYGNAPNGRGGLFRGGSAQLRLVPSTAATHPGSGQAGDLFLDKSSRLWFCKGGAVWKQLA